MSGGRLIDVHPMLRFPTCEAMTIMSGKDFAPGGARGPYDDILRPIPAFVRLRRNFDAGRQLVLVPAAAFGKVKT